MYTDGTHEQVKRIGSSGVERELCYGRPGTELSARGVEEVSALGPDSLGVDYGLVGGHVGEFGVFGMAGGDSGIHRINIHGDTGANMSE